MQLLLAWQTLLPRRVIHPCKNTVVKKLTLLLLFSAALIPSLRAQTPAKTSAKDTVPRMVFPGVEHYDQLKKEGKLGTGVYLVPADGEPRKMQPSVYRNPNPNPTPASPPANCNCLIPIDATFSVVPFSFSQGPDYRNDDDSSPQISLPFNFCFYGTTQNNVFINNNGNISFGQSYGTFSATGFPTGQVVMIAPFWADVDTWNPISGLVYYKITPSYMIVRWQTVGYYSQHADKLNDFQLIITDGNDPILPLGSNVGFCYGDMQWTTGDASGGTNGFGGIAANVGANKGDGVNYIQMGTFDQPGSTYNGPLGAPSGIDWLDNQQFFFNACNTGPNNNVPPILTSQQVCDTLTVCVGDTLHFTASWLSPEASQTTTPNLVAPGVVGITLTSFVIGNTATIGFDLVASSANTGYNTITVSGTDNGSPAQTTSGTIVVYVAPSPTTTTSSTPGSCGANTGTATVNASGGSGIYTYVWQPGGQTTSTATGLAPNTYIVTVTDTLSGCDTKDTVIIAPTGNLATTPTQTNVTCYGMTNGTANVAVNSGTTPYTYVWTPSVSVTASASGLAAGTYTVDITDAGGCTGQQIFTITQPSLVPLVATANNDTNICVGASVTLTIAGSGGSGAPYTYAWSNGNTNASQSVTPNTTTTYTVSVADQCGTPHDTDSVTVFVHPYPLTTFSSNDSSGCAPLCVDFSDLSSVTNGNITQWSWNFGDNSPIDNTQNPTHCYQQSGQYTVSLTATSGDGCPTTTTINNMITVYQQPVASFTLGPQPTVLSNPTINFTDQSTGAVSWLWDFADPLDPSGSTVQNPSHTYSDTGAYCARLIVTGSYPTCRDTATECLVISPEILIWVPNSFTPNGDQKNDVFQPMFNSELYIQNYEMLVFDRWGNLIFKTVDPYQGWDGRVQGHSGYAQIDTYVYKIWIRDKYNKDYDFIGSINMVR